MFEFCASRRFIYSQHTIQKRTSRGLQVIALIHRSLMSNQTKFRWFLRSYSSEEYLSTKVKLILSVRWALQLVVSSKRSPQAYKLLILVIWYLDHWCRWTRWFLQVFWLTLQCCLLEGGHIWIRVTQELSLIIKL